MNYIEFTETVCDKVRKLYQNEDCTVEVQHTLKNNAVSLCALVIRYTGEEAAPAIYLEQYYDMYKDGTSVEDIVKDIVEEFKEAMEGYDIILPDLTDFESVKDSIVCRLINTESNSKMLEDVPHKEFLDLSIVFYGVVKDTEGSMGSFIISNNLAGLWGADAESLYCIAINNTYRMYPVCISNMCDILMEYIQMDPDALPDSESDLMDKESLSMYVLTNSVRTYGAIGMICKEALRAFAEKFGSCYILPSSVHEVILIPASGCDKHMAGDFEGIVQDVNTRGVPPQDVLSWGPYYYDKESDEILKLNNITLNKLFA